MTAHPAVENVEHDMSNPEWEQVMAKLMYELTFKGAGSNTLASASGWCTVQSRNDVTVLRSAVADQAALHDLIDRIHTLGLELIEIRRVSGDRCQGETRQTCDR
jgi:hypothetical protein